MKIILTLILTFVTATIYGQFKPEDVFVTGEHFNKKKCKVDTHRVWGYMVFLTDDRFCSYSYVKSEHDADSAIVIGHYKIFNDTLHFTSVESLTLRAVINDTTNLEIQSSEKYTATVYPDVKFKIAECDNGKILLVGFAGNKFWYAKRYAKGEKFWRKYEMKKQLPFLLR